MSVVRSSSSVRNLRAVFESHESFDARGKSPTGSLPGSHSGTSPISVRKIRSSFVAVEPSRRSVSVSAAMSASDSIARVPSNTGRRESFSLSQEKDQDAIDNMKKTVSHELSKRKSAMDLKEDVVPEVAAMSAVTTPIIEAASDPLEPSSTSDAVSGTYDQSEHPDKPISSIEDAEATLQSADVTDEAVISGDAASGSAKTNGDSTKGASAPKTKAAGSKRVSTSAASTSNRRTSSVTGLQSAPAIRAKPRSPTRPVQLSSHLTAQTASSRAKHQPDDQSPAKSPPPAGRTVREIPAHLLAPTASSRAKHEEQPKKQITPTKTREVPAHLLAPTAASRAKHEDISKSETLTATLTTAPAPARTAKPRTSLAPRQSLAPAASRTAANTTKPASSRQSLAGQQTAQPAPASKKPTTVPSSDFLARMTKPTEASSSHKAGEPKPETAETKPAPKPAKSSARPKPAAPAAASTVASTKPAAAAASSKAATKARGSTETKNDAVEKKPAPGSAAAAQPDAAISSEAVAEPTQQPIVEAAEGETPVTVDDADKPRAEAIANAVPDATEAEAAKALAEVKQLAPAELTPAEPAVDEPAAAAPVEDAPVEQATVIEPSVKAAAEEEPVVPEPATEEPENTNESIVGAEAPSEPEKPLEDVTVAEPDETSKSETKGEEPESAVDKSTAVEPETIQIPVAKAEVNEPAAAPTTTEDVAEEEQPIPEEFIPRDVTPAKPLSPVMTESANGGGLMLDSKYADSTSESPAPAAPTTPGKLDEAAAATPSDKDNNGDDDTVKALQTPAFDQEVIH